MPVAGNDDVGTGFPGAFQYPVVRIILEDGKREDYKQIISAADKLSAYIKCLEEINAGNKEFSRAKKAIWEAIVRMDLREVDYFIKHFIPSFELTLDELSFPDSKKE